MILSNMDILKAYEQGAIWFNSPHDTKTNKELLIEQTRINAVDVTLGSIVMEEIPRGIELPAYTKVDTSSGYVTLVAGRNYLAHTHEFIGTTEIPFQHEYEIKLEETVRSDLKLNELTSLMYKQELWLAPMFDSRSTLARRFVPMHMSAGFGDVGFCSRWAMEIHPTSTILLKIGTPVAQVSFQTVSSKPSVLYSSGYNAAKTLEEWSFEQNVLPKALV